MVTQAEGVKLVDQAEAQLAKAEQALVLGDKAVVRRRPARNATLTKPFP